MSERTWSQETPSPEVLSQVESGAILEYGAGSGKLAVDMLERLEELDALPSAYLVLEVSPDLRERQQSLIAERLPRLADRVSWVDSVPDRHRGVLVANEVLDSMPVERFVRRDAGVMQLRVAADEDTFAFIEAPAPEILSQAVATIERDLGAQLPDGFLSEVCLAIPPWIGGMAAALREGVAFLFDYGVSRREYYAPDRDAGWLRCHFRHHAHDDPLILAGGLEEEMRDFDALNTQEQVDLSRQVKTLTLPGEMGERFKCMALRKGSITTPTAFNLADRTHTL